MVAPGRFTVAIEKFVQGRSSALSEPQPFEARGAYEIPAAERTRLLSFEKKVARLQRAVTGAAEAMTEAKNRIAHAKQAVLDTPSAPPSLGAEVRRIAERLAEVEIEIKGDAVLAARNEPTPPSIVDRVEAIVGAQWNATSPPTTSSEEAYAFAAQAFSGQLEKLRQLLTVDWKKVEDALESSGAPWTPGRLPVWRPE
jgi:hypothetical protein